MFRIKVLIRDRIGFHLDNVAYILSHTSSYLGRYTEDKSDTHFATLTRCRRSNRINNYSP